MNDDPSITNTPKNLPPERLCITWDANRTSPPEDADILAIRNVNQYGYGTENICHGPPIIGVVPCQSIVINKLKLPDIMNNPLKKERNTDSVGSFWIPSVLRTIYSIC